MRKRKSIILLATSFLFLSPMNLHIANANIVEEPEADTTIDQDTIIGSEATKEEVIQSEVDSEGETKEEMIEEKPTVSEGELTTESNEEVGSNEEVEQNKEEEVTEETDEPAKILKFEIQAVEATFPFKEGDRSEKIIELKKMLNKIGFGRITETEFFGDFTTKRVKQFQAYYGLTANGIVDEATFSKVKEIYSSPLQKGKRHDDLIPLKKKLNWIGYGNITVTTYFGSFTEKRVKEFQKDYGLHDNGIIDEKTKQKIDQAFVNVFQQGSRHDSIIELKKMLNNLGFGHITVTTLYGGFTTKKVKEFQEYYGLNATGNADLATLDKLKELSSSPFQVGKRHKDTIQLKKNLNRLGFGNIKVTNLYGSFTKKRVKDFQKYYGLKSTGIADQRTLTKIDELLNSPLQQGKRHDDLIDLKKKLNWTGYGYITVTSYYGNFMKNRVKKFQKEQGLPVSGMIDEKTKQKIDQVFANVFQQGSRHDSIIELKKMLNSTGFGHIKVTTLYGSFTTKKVKEFQAYFGLNATGNADLATFDKLKELSSSPFQKGKRHPDTITLKKNLNSLGFGNIMVTDLYGSFTAKRVKDFQRYYGLKVTGIADSYTLAKIDEIMNSPFQEGKRHPDTIKLKENLNRLGFGNISVTDLYGSFTAKRVKDFQAHFGLNVNGIADSRTLGKINEILASPFQTGKRHPETVDLKKKLNQLGYGYIKVTDLYGDFTEKKVREFQKDFGLPISGIADEITRKSIKEAEDRRIFTSTQYNVTFNDALNIQMKQLQQTDMYRNEPAYVSAKYIKTVQSDIITGSSVNLRSTPDFSKAPVKNVGYGTKIDIIKTVNGKEYNGSNKWYQIKYQGMTAYVHSSLAGTVKTTITTTNVNVRAKASTKSHIYGVLKKGTTVKILDAGKTWHRIAYSAWRNPTRSDVENYMNPNNHDEFQHLVLSSSVGVSDTQLNSILKGRGILEGKGKAFIAGANKHKVNEMYLISHAFLETGNGTSTLAKGVEVGKDKNGNLVLVTSNNRKNLTSIKTTYNMFGIGAADSDPLRLGAIRAYKEGWFTPEAAIEGGAKFIGDRYIHNQYKQNTLYKMRWNPANPGYPQYATDIGWAVKQVTEIKNMVSMLKFPKLHFDIVKYK